MKPNDFLNPDYGRNEDNSLGNYRIVISSAATGEPVSVDYHLVGRNEMTVEQAYEDIQAREDIIAQAFGEDITNDDGATLNPGTSTRHPLMYPILVAGLKALQLTAYAAHMDCTMQRYDEFMAEIFK